MNFEFRRQTAVAVTAASLLCLVACGGHNGAASLFNAPAGTTSIGALPIQPIGAPVELTGPVPAQTFAPSPFLANTTYGIHALQVFDEAHGYTISFSDATANGERYASVWGVRGPAMAAAWHSNNTTLNALIYTPFDTDATGSGLNKPTAWWQANHPDWILYECDKSTIAFVGGLSGVPLDISNPEVWQYQVSLLGSFAEANGYNGIAADIVSQTNNTGHVDFGRGGCGVWNKTHTTWVAKFSGFITDPKWSAAAANWVANVHNALHDRAVFPRTLALAVNTNVDHYQPPVNRVGGDAAEKAIVSNADVVLNEAGFAMWGKYVDNGTFNNAVGWMVYTQSLGEAALITANWNQQSKPPTVAQVDYSIATYLMGKEQAAALYVGRNHMYGKENYYNQYGAKIGRACGPMYGGPNDPNYFGKKVYLRKYSGGLAVVNVSANLPYTVVLPKLTYTNIEGGQIASPLTLPPNSGFVLLAGGGCK